MTASAGHEHDSGRVPRSRAEQAREIGLFRYALIREPADPQLSTKQRGLLVRALAGTEHVGPFGERVRVSRVTLDRWILSWRRGGFDALVPSTRCAQPRTLAVVLELAAALKREVPARTAAQITAILTVHAGPDSTVPSARTLQRHFARLELNTRPDGTPPRAFGRFEAAAANDRWTGDALHGPVIAGRKAYLFAFIDDHSRALVGYRWGHSEDTVRLEAALRAGLLARGVPKVVYLDNGSAMVSGQLRRALAVLGITLTHSKPGQPAGRGKIERFFRTVREQFLIELAVPGALSAINDIGGLNALFTAWVETVYHPRAHSETHQPPLERFLAAGPPALPTLAELHEAFLWSHTRQVTKTATISLFGNRYEVDAALVGRKVEVVFDPFDLTTLQVRFQGRPMGLAVPQQIGRHVHPDARPDLPPPVPAPTGIDYLALVAQQHLTQLATRINYTGLTGEVGQLDRIDQITDKAGEDDPRDEPGPAPDVEPDVEPDVALEAELASFRDLSHQPASTELPGQLDLTVLAHALTNELTDELSHHDSNHDSNEGQR